MFSPFLVCGINVCSEQVQDKHNMRENVRQSNLQLVFLQTSEFYSSACFVIFGLNFKKVKDLKTGQDITK